MAAPPWVCAVLHAAGLAVLPLCIQGGSLLESDYLRRGKYIVEHRLAWQGGWAVWMLSAVSLAVFYLWWRVRLPGRRLATVGALLGAIGMCCDLRGEWLLSVVLPVRLADSAALASGDWRALERTATLLTAGAANGLYTLGGV
jgi:hypothetical protein